MMITRWTATIVLVSICLFQLSASIAADPVHSTDDSEGGSLPTHVLVHGTYGGAWIWYKIQVLLESEGFPVHALDLTSHGVLDDRTPDSVRTLEDWASPLFDCLSNMTEKVILVTHSLGGAAVSLAMERYPEKIAKAVFVAAVMPKDGEAVNGPFVEKFQQLVDAGVLRLNYGDGSLAVPTSTETNVTAAHMILYPRCPNEDFILIRDLSTPVPFRPFCDTLTLTDERYGSVPRFYIKSGLDNLMNIETQQKICDDNPPKVQFILKNGDHAPMFSETPYLYFMLKSILKY